MSPNADYVVELAACPHCGAEWRYFWKDGEVYSRLIGIYSRERDMTVAWQCPGCGAQWPRSQKVADL